jgi:hypothetical protein
MDVVDFVLFNECPGQIASTKQQRKSTALKLTAALCISENTAQFANITEIDYLTVRHIRD